MSTEQPKPIPKLGELLSSPQVQPDFEVDEVKLKRDQLQRLRDFQTEYQALNLLKS
jgi:hypothetical protein